MKYEELLELVREVGKAGLSEFEYEEGNLHIRMSAQPAADGESKECDFAVETNMLIRDGQNEEKKKKVKRELIAAPVEGVFWFSRLDGSSCPVNLGDHITRGQVLGKLDSRGDSFEIFSDLEGEIVTVYIEHGEELVAREPMFMVAAKYDEE